MKKLIASILISLFFLPISNFAQADYVDKEAKEKSLNPSIYFDAYNYLSSDSSKSKLRLFFQVPFTSLSFIKKNRNFVANYSIDINFFDSSGTNLKFEKIWTEKLNASTIEQVRNPNNYNITFKNIEIEPNYYKLRIKIFDNNSLSKVNFTKKILVRKINPDFGMSDIMLFIKKIKAKGKNEIVPNIKNTVTTGSDSLNLFYYIYSNKDRNVLISYRLYSFKNDDAFISNKSLFIKKGKNKIDFTLKPVKFRLGKYNIRVKIKDDNSQKEIEISKNFFARIENFPPSITDLDLAIKEMQYIAPPSVIDDLLETKNYSERLKKFKDYWKSKDPSPATPINEVLFEYYRRVDYANKHFKHYFPGWKTDMGKVYITLGPPHQVENHPLELGTKPYVIWYYYDINKEFIFVDDTGFGDYRLITPLYGDWYQYRN